MRRQAQDFLIRWLRSWNWKVKIKWKNWRFFQNPLLRGAHTFAGIRVTDCSLPCTVIIDVFSRVGLVALQPFPCCCWWMSTVLRWSDTVTNQDSITALCCVTPFEQRTLAPLICHPPSLKLNLTLPLFGLYVRNEWTQLNGSMSVKLANSFIIINRQNYIFSSFFSSAPCHHECMCNYCFPHRPLSLGKIGWTPLKFRAVGADSSLKYSSSNPLIPTTVSPYQKVAIRKSCDFGWSQKLRETILTLGQCIPASCCRSKWKHFRCADGLERLHSRFVFHVD